MIQNRKFHFIATLFIPLNIVFLVFLNNSSEVNYYSFSYALTLVTAFSICILFVFAILSKMAYKELLYMYIINIWIFFWGVYRSSTIYIIERFSLFSFYDYIFLFWVLLFIVAQFAVYKYFSSLASIKVVKFLSLFFALLTLINIPSVVWSLYFQGYSSERILGDGEVNASVEKIEDTNLPSIYFLVFDRYTSNDVLKKFYSFDNTEFQKKLESKGFVFKTNSVANYGKTLQSLTSTLNMNYISDLMDVQPNERSAKYLFNLLENHLVQEKLRNYGYEYIHMGSWWQGTEKNKNADVNINYKLVDEFAFAVYSNTIFNPLFIYTGSYDHRRESYDREKKKISSVMKIAEKDGKKFVFSHFLTTHPPYVFDENGNYYPRTNISIIDKDSYITQIKYTNIAVLDMVDYIQENDPNSIILIQSDEGPFPERYAKNQQGFYWSQATEEEIRIKTGILNAYYFPNMEISKYPQIESPVNLFRYIFNLYFNEQNEILDDTHYIFEHDTLLYSNKEI